MNECRWLRLNLSTPCNKPCRGEYCGQHAQQVRNESLGPIPCIQCGVGVKGKAQLCARCGEKRYRELKRYYTKQNHDSVLKCERDYINKFAEKL